MGHWRDNTYYRVTSAGADWGKIKIEVWDDNYALSRLVDAAWAIEADEEDVQNIFHEMTRLLRMVNQWAE